MATASSRQVRVVARVGRRAAAVSLIVTLWSVMFAVGPARAACDVLDPTCAVETVEETVDSATETVDDTVEEATETVDETVVIVTEEVDETVEIVTEEVDETVEGTVRPVDEVIGGPSQPNLPGVNPDPGPPLPTVDPAPSGGGGGNGSDVVGSGVGDGPRGTPRGGVVGPFVLDPPALGDAPAVESSLEPRGFLGGIAGSGGSIVSRIAFPLALALLVFLFVAFQDRVDGRDPKLALAATSPDVLRFA
jgi:hypothetical protein